MVLTFFEHSFLKNCIILSNHVKSILHLCQTGCKKQQKKDQIVIVRGKNKKHKKKKEKKKCAFNPGLFEMRPLPH